MDRLESIKIGIKRLNLHGELLDDIVWLIEQAEKVEKLESLQKKTAESLVKCRVKIKEVRDIVV